MKKTNFLSVIFLLCFFAGQAQSLDSLPAGTKHLDATYMKKRSTYKTVGWVLLGTGAALFGTAYLINVENGFNGPTKAENLFTAGLIAAAVSPPFFILASANKRKAQLALKSERVTSAIGFSKPFYPAISLRINL